MKDYTNSQITHIIAECIHSQRDRLILVDRLVHGLTYEQLAEKHELSVRQCKNIVYKSQERLSKYI